MLIQFNSNYTPTGTITLGQSLELYNKAISAGAKPRLLIADVNSLLAAPDFQELCTKKGIDDFSIGTKLVVESDHGHSTITLVAKNNNGVSSLASIISKIPDNLSSPSNHKFAIADLKGCLDDVEVLADETYPSFLAKVHGGDKDEARVLAELREVGISNKTLKSYSYDSSVYQKNPSLDSYNKYAESVDSILSVDLNLFSALEYPLAKSRFNKVTGAASDDKSYFRLKSCADKAVFVHSKGLGIQDKFFSDFENINYSQNETVPSINDSHDAIAKALEAIESNYSDDDPSKIMRIERVRTESSIVLDMGYKNYFDIVSGFGDYCLSNGVPVYMRGSAPSSEILYQNKLSPSELDPFSLGLDLRRFIGYHRKDNQADVDLELPHTHVHLFEDYINSLDIGATTSMISVLEKYSKFKSTLSFVADTFDVDSKSLDDVNAKLFRTLNSIGAVSSYKDYKNLTIKAFKASGVMEQASFTQEERKLATGVIMMDGWSKGLKNHPSKKIISTDKNPMFPTTVRKNGLISHISKDNCERMGQTPFDILSSKISTGLMKAEKFIDSVGLPPLSIQGAFSDNNEYFSRLFDELPRNFNMITQLSSEYASGILKDNAPKNYQDLAMVFALIRPAVDETEEDEQDAYLLGGGDNNDPLKKDMTVQSILKRTRGEFIYDEQILEIATQVANLSDEQGDKLRIAIRKFKPELIDSLRQPFVDGAVANGRTEEFATKLYDRIGGYVGKYFFNESHAMSYATIALKQMVLKDKYPSLFYQFFVKEHEYSGKNLQRYSVSNDAPLTTKQDSILHGVKEMTDLGFVFKAPCVNKSKRSVFWSDGLDRKTIIPSLYSTGVNKTFADAVVKVRMQNRENGGINDAIELIDMLNYELKLKNGSHYESIKANLITMVNTGALDNVPLTRDLNLDSITDVTVKRGVISKFVTQYQNRVSSPTSSGDLDLQVSASDILNEKDMVSAELKSFGYSPTKGFSIQAPKNKFTRRQNRISGLKS